MPAINDRLANDGALVEVRLELTAAELLRLTSTKQQIPPPVKLAALIDTGADATFIDPAVLKILPLPISAFHFTNVPALGGFGLAIERDADLTILHPSRQALMNLALPGWHVYEQAIGKLGYQMLIGRDVLASCDFHYYGRNGAFALEY